MLVLVAFRSDAAEVPDRADPEDVKPATDVQHRHLETRIVGRVPDRFPVLVTRLMLQPFVPERRDAFLRDAGHLVERSAAEQAEGAPHHGVGDLLGRLHWPLVVLLQVPRRRQTAAPGADEAQLKRATLICPAVVVVVGRDDRNRATQRRWSLTRREHRRGAHIRRSVDRRVTVAPLLRRDPLERVVAVGTLLVKRLEVAFRRVAAATVADHDGVAALRQLECARHHGDKTSARLLLVVRRPRDHARHGLARLVGVFGTVQIGAQDNPVTHGNLEVLLHQHSFDGHIALRSVHMCDQRYARKRHFDWGAR